MGMAVGAKITEADLAPGQRQKARLSLVHGSKTEGEASGEADFDDAAEVAAEFLDF